MGLIILGLLFGSLWLWLLCSWCSILLIDHPVIWLSMVLDYFVLIWLKRALMPIVIYRGLLEREFDCVGGRFVRRIDSSEDSHKSASILWICCWLMNCWGTNCLGLERVVNTCCWWRSELMVCYAFCVDSPLLHLTRVESSVLLFFVVFPIRVHSVGFTGLGLMSPSFYVIFFLFF